MADNVPRPPVTDPPGNHLTNEQFADLGFSFFPIVPASTDRNGGSGISMFPGIDVSVDRKDASAFNDQAANHGVQLSSSALMDSDDDFGDFASVPPDILHSMEASLSADPFRFPVTPTFDLDVGNSLDAFGFHTSSTHQQMRPAEEDLFGHRSAMVEAPAEQPGIESTTPPAAKALENTSDDDWGDFVDNSTPATWDNSLEFDWFDTSQQRGGQNLPTGSVAGSGGGLATDLFALENEVWTASAEVDVPKSEEMAPNFAFNGVDLFASSSEGRKALPSGDTEGFAFAHDEMATKKEVPALQQTPSGQKTEKATLSSAPIPLSLFGECEVELENSNTELPDLFPKSFQGHSRSKARSTDSLVSGGVNLSDLIANLYSESQRDSQISGLPNTNDRELNETSKDCRISRKDLFDTLSINKEQSSLEECMFSLNLSMEHAADLSSTKEGHSSAMIAKASDATVNSPDSEDQSSSLRKEPKVELHSEAAPTFPLLDALCKDDRCTLVKAWASVLAVCATELEYALTIWKQARNADVHLDLLADLQGRKYFAAIGQIYVVALILAATSNFYRPWFSLASEEAESLQTDLERCKAAWLQTSLKEGVHLALDRLQDSVPDSVISWKRIEEFAAVVLEAYLQAANATVQSICRMSLLPMAPFNCTGVPTVEWGGSSYLLPLANVWANCVSHTPPIDLVYGDAKTTVSQGDDVGSIPGSSSGSRLETK